MEFLAMANHRKAIRAEIADSIESCRTMQAEALSQSSLGKGAHQFNPLGVTVLIAAVSRLLVLEKIQGMSVGHAEALTIVEHCIAQLTSDAEPGRKPRSPVRVRRQKRTAKSGSR